MLYLDMPPCMLYLDMPPCMYLDMPPCMRHRVHIPLCVLYLDMLEYGMCRLWKQAIALLGVRLGIRVRRNFAWLLGCARVECCLAKGTTRLKGAGSA